MKIFETKKDLASALSAYRNQGGSIGLVPTMGALHDGHISLVEQCCRENQATVVSIFVNPTQFNDKNDLANYPRMLSADAEKLEKTACNFIFAPTVEEMYPQEDTRTFEFGLLGQVMEGAHRPGHFNGVAQIVSKLFDAVQPDKAYFGEKDFQQLAVIRHMTRALHYPIQIIGCPTVREPDGLSMSSRNMLLTPEQRKVAPVIAKTLRESQVRIKEMPLDALKQWVVTQIDSNPEMQTEYFEIVDRDTLQPVAKFTGQKLQGCIAVRVGKIRLIDNIAYE